MTSTDAREPPADDEFEVSNFGPGVGECCLVHLGDGEWFVVDSCRTDDGVPVSEWYLERLGLDPAEAVSGILVTHWHDDHVDGVADLLSTCNSATFYCSAAYRTEEFLTFIETGRDAQFGPSGTDELRAVLELLKERRSDGQRPASVGPELVKENERIHTGATLDLWALSPSSATMRLGRQELAEELPDVGDSKRRLVSQGPNKLSVVLWLDAVGTNVLLGGDLESTNNPETGWTAVSPPTDESSAILYKVAHHGSPNADADCIWSDLLAGEPINVVTPYRPSSRPRDPDLERLADRSGRGYSTAPPTGGDLPSRDRAVEATLDEMVDEHRPLRTELGHVRFRRPLASDADVPELAIDGPVRKLGALV